MYIKLQLQFFLFSRQLAKLHKVMELNVKILNKKEKEFYYLLKEIEFLDCLMRNLQHIVLVLVKGDIVWRHLCTWNILLYFQLVEKILFAYL